MNLILESLHNALAMLWLMFWPLVFGLSLSAFLQSFVTGRELEKAFGNSGLRSVLLATGFGAASSSCSYAAVATGKTAFQRGAALVPTLAFMFAATNLVVELGILLWQLMGWIFVAAEFFGGLLMIAIVWALVALTKPAGLEQKARNHLGQQQDDEHGHHHHHHAAKASENQTLGARLRSRHNWYQIGKTFFMDVKMLWKEVLIGVLIAGFLSVLVPKEWWQALFLHEGSGWLRLLENATVGPLIAVASFVCSDGNVPLASLMWSNGISFGGVIAFIYGDLLIIPLLLLYRKYFGFKTALFITGWLYISMVIAGLGVDLIFGALGWIPSGPRPPHPAMEMGFSWDYTAWLNVGAIVAVTGLAILRKLATNSHQHSAMHHSAGK